MELSKVLLHQKTLPSLPVNANSSLIFLHDKIHFRILSLLFSSYHGQDPVLFEENIVRKLNDKIIMGKLKGRALQDLLGEYLILETRANDTASLAQENTGKDNIDKWNILSTFPSNLLKHNRKPVGETEQAWYRNLLEWIAVNHKIGNISNINTIREISDCLQSIFPPSEIIFHFKKDKEGREEHLIDILNLSRGARLYSLYTAKLNGKPTQSSTSSINSREDIVESLLPKFSAQSPAPDTSERQAKLAKIQETLSALLKTLHQHAQQTPLIKNEVAFPLLRSISDTYLMAEVLELRLCLADMLARYKQYVEVHPSLQNWNDLVLADEESRYSVGNSGMTGKSVTNEGVQTETHPPYQAQGSISTQDSFINRYNAQFKPKGVDQASQSTEKTFRRSVEAQCYVHGKSSYTQTRRDTKTGPARTVRAINGKTLTLEL